MSNARHEKTGEYTDRSPRLQTSRRGRRRPVGRTATHRLHSTRRYGMGRRRTVQGRPRTQASCHEGHEGCTGMPRPGAHPAAPPGRVRHGNRRAPVRATRGQVRPSASGSAGGVCLGHGLHARVAPGSRGSVKRRSSYPAGQAPIRSAPRRRVAVAQRGCTAHASSRVGGTQRGRSTQGVREVHLRTRADRPPTDRGPPSGSRRNAASAKVVAGQRQVVQRIDMCHTRENRP